MKLEREQNPKTPDRDELERALSGVEDATLAEELERKRLSLTQEPAAKIETKKQPHDTVSVRSTRPAETEQKEVVGEDVEDYIAKWKEVNGEDEGGWVNAPYPYVKFTGDCSITRALLDEILTKTIEKNKGSFSGAIKIANTIANCKKIEVEAIHDKKFFYLRVFGKDDTILGVTVSCAGNVESFTWVL